MWAAIWALATAPFVMFIIGLAIACIVAVSIIERKGK